MLRQGSAVDTIAAFVEAEVAREREACAKLATREDRGCQDPETGETPCGMEIRHGVCECSAKIEHGDDIARLIMARGAP